MATLLYRLGRLAFRRRWYVALLWVAWRDAEGNYPLIEGGWIDHAVSAALDRLADAYDSEADRDT